MKILLIDNIQNISASSSTYSIGLLSLSTILKEKDYNIELVNFPYLFLGELPYHYNSVNNFETMADFILSRDPQILGFTSMCNSFHNSLILSQMINKRNKNIKIIFGGPQVAVHPEKIMEEFPWIDLISVGEGEKNIEKIINGLSNNDLSDVSGIVFRKDNKINRNRDLDILKNLDDLPMLDYSLVSYFFTIDTVAIEVGRGCPYNCTYCSTSKYWKHKFRMKTEDRIIKEIIEIKKILDGKKVSFAFIHDNFTVNSKFTQSLCEKLKNLDVAWYCSARVDNLSGDLIKDMADAGCKEIYMGVETGSKRMQKMINKNLNLDRVDTVIDSIFENKIDPTVSFMYGFPEETEEDLLLTLNMIYRLMKKKVYDCQFHSLCILNGTRLYDEYKNRLILRDYFSDISDSSNLEMLGDSIGKNKDIFSHFYTLEGSLVEKYVLLEKFVSYIFINLYERFSKTINLIVKSFENNILDFYTDFIDNSDYRFVEFFRIREYMRDFKSDYELMSNFIFFFELYITRKSVVDQKFRKIKNSFSSEKMKFTMRIGANSFKFKAKNHL